MAKASGAAPVRRSTGARRGRPPKRANRARRGRRMTFTVLILVCALVGGTLGILRFNALKVHLRYADLYLSDLPAGFEGTKVLFLSDIDIKSGADGRRATRLLDGLAALKPDLLLLGGDYRADTLLQTLNGGGENVVTASERAFIASLGDFPATMGKFAVAGEDDNAAELEKPFAEADVTLLRDRCLPVAKGNETIYLAGLSDAAAAATPYASLGDYFHGDECVLVLAHNPASYVGVRVAEASDGGAWADAVLSGHTLGGQIRLFGRNLRTLAANETRVLCGWAYADDLPLLVSSGVGCEDVNLRLGSSAEVWLITLHRQTIAAPQLPELRAGN